MSGSNDDGASWHRIDKYWCIVFKYTMQSVMYNT